MEFNADKCMVLHSARANQETINGRFLENRGNSRIKAYKSKIPKCGSTGKIGEGSI